MANRDPDVPAEAPPSYQQATGSSNAASSSSRPAATSSASHLTVPGDHKGSMPAAARRSMEDETRRLPKGWVRSYDPTSNHQYFVDTTKDPPRSIWVHPYDDEQYLSTLSSDERERIEEESMGRGNKHPPSNEDIIAASSDDEDASSTHQTSSYSGELPPRDEGKGKGKERSFGRKFKDKVTGTTHEEREVQRKKRAEQERKMYEYHQRVRQAMTVAQQTGEPQRIGTDTDGKEIWVEPPNYSGGYSGGGYGYNPYRGGVYTTPNARYIRPPNPYARPYGGGYGGGYGMPLALGGGLAGGLLLGGALGGFGGGF